MASPALSIVAPVYNEARILPELVARCIDAGERSGVPFELILVDDASRDETPTILSGLAHDSRLRPCRLAANAGQFRATQAGLREARGEWVVVLDGDLQDPPEVIPELVGALLSAESSVVAVLAVKSRRDDPAAFMIGQFIFHRLQRVLSRVTLPHGAGSYCVMRRAVARRVAKANMKDANLAALVAVAAQAMAGRLKSLPYEKGPRYDHNARVGWRGLIAEAIGSLGVTGALPRLLVLAAVVLGVSAFAVCSPRGQTAMLAAAALATGSAIWVGSRTRRALALMRAPLVDD